MQTKILSCDQPEAISMAISVLAQGELVVFPTDTVYGVAADINNPLAIDKIFSAKGRDFAKAIPVLIGNLQQLSQVTPGLTPAAQKLAERFWPGALTLVIPRLLTLPQNLSATPTVGIRMPNHSFTLALLNQSGPLAVTSANLSGCSNTLTAADVLAQLDGKVALILDGGKTPGETPSTVVDCSKDTMTILRHGAIPADEILRAV